MDQTWKNFVHQGRGDSRSFLVFGGHAASSIWRVVWSHSNSQAAGRKQQISLSGQYRVAMPKESTVSVVARCFQLKL